MTLYSRIFKYISAAVVAFALMPASLRAQVRFSISPSGAEVTDTQTGLIWRRCVEGMIWNGTSCSGTSLVFTHENALVRAKSQSGWRLPNIKEISSIHDRIKPPIDFSIFPGTPQVSTVYFWSSTPDVAGPVNAFAAGFSSIDSGGVHKYGRRETLYVRLVRDGA